MSNDVRRLNEIIVNAYGFDHFASKMVSSDWFDLIDPDMLKSVSDDQPWLLRILAIHMKEHIGKFTNFVEENFERWVMEDTGFAELGFVGERLKDDGLPLLVRALQKSESTRQRCDRELTECSEAEPSDPRRAKALRVLDSISKLEYHALQAYQMAKPINPTLVKMADYLMNPHTTINKDHQTDTIPIKLVEGMNCSSATEIVKVLVYKVRAWRERNELLYIPMLGSVADIDQDSHIGMDSMVSSLCKALTKARNLGLPTAWLVGNISVLPNHIQQRLVAWLYSGADDVEHTELVDFVVSSCGSRHPTGDDELLLGRLKRDGHLDHDTVARICSQIREAPDPKRMAGPPCQWDFDEEDLWRILWAHMLHRSVELPRGWDFCIEVLNPLVNKERKIVDEWKSGNFSAQVNPIGPEISNGEDPHTTAAKIAEWDTKTLGLPGYASTFDISQKLTSAIKHDAPKWAEDPADIINTLHHPVYVAGYFDGLARSVGELHKYVDRLISAVQFVRTHPWDVPVLNTPPFGYDVSWESADTAGIKLIKTMAEKNILLDDEKLCEVWDLLSEAVVNRPAESPEDAAESLIDAADRKPHTCALTAMIHLIVYAVNRKKDIPGKVLAALTESVRLTGRNGREHRAVLGMWIRQLRMALPNWFEQYEPFLLGNGVSEELGQTTLDIHIQWVKPDLFILKKYRDMVLDAVKRGVPRAMDCLLLCMLEGIAGYGPKLVAESLVGMGPERVSEAGNKSAWLLGRYAGADHIQRGTDFWACVLDLNPEPKALAGFGRWATVSGVNQSQWERLTLSTCKAGKKLDFAREVAGRIDSSQSVTETGLKILALLMQSDLSYDTYSVAEHVLDALRKSKDALGTKDIWIHLQDIMVQQGFNSAAEL